MPVIRRYAHLNKWHRSGRTDIDPGVVGASTTTALAVSPATPASSGATETLTATVVPSGAVGQVQFKDGATVIATVTVSGGTAVTTTVLGSGTHSLKATFVPGTGAWLTSSSSAVNYVVNGTATTTSIVLTVSPASPASAGTVETLTATMTPSGAVGSVQFYVDSVASGAPVAVSGGVASKTLTLTAATHDLDAIFTPTNSAIYTASNAANVAYVVGSGGGGGSYVGLVKWGESDRDWTNFKNDESLSGGSFHCWRSYDSGASGSTWAGTQATTNAGYINYMGLWSFKPGTWTSSFLNTNLAQTSWPTDASNLLSCLKGVPLTFVLCMTCNHEPDGGGGGIAGADQPLAGYAPMQRRIRPIVDAANAYRRQQAVNAGTLSTYQPILFGPILCEDSMRRTDTTTVTGEAYIDLWWPGNGIWDFFGWDVYSKGNNPIRTTSAMFDRIYAYSVSGRVDSVTGEVHELLPVLVGELGWDFTGTDDDTQRKTGMTNLHAYAQTREFIAISYFNRGQKYGDALSDGRNWELVRGTGGSLELLGSF